MDVSRAEDIVTDLLVRYSFQVLAALAIIGVGLLCARLVGRLIARWLERTAIELHLQRLLVRIGKALVLLFTLIVALDKFGVQVTALVAGISVAGVAASFAVQGVLANVAAGLSIMLSRHFRIGDYIEIGTVRGQVQAIDLSMTVLRTLEDARVIIPNRRIVGEIIYNYTAERRVPLSISLAYGENLDAALQVIHEVLAGNPRVLTTPAPDVGITRLDDSGIQLTLRPWCRAEEYWPVHYEVYRALLDRFAERRITLAVPRQEVRLLGAGQ
jgi:small conductance mechanosensitive channel